MGELRNPNVRANLIPLNERSPKKRKNQERVTLGLIKGAIDGRAENYKVILETLGELKPEENVGTPNVSINIIDNSALEKAMYEENREEE